MNSAGVGSPIDNPDLARAGVPGHAGRPHIIAPHLEFLRFEVTLEPLAQLFPIAALWVHADLGLEAILREPNARPHVPHRIGVAGNQASPIHEINRQPSFLFLEGVLLPFVGEDQIHGVGGVVLVLKCPHGEVQTVLLCPLLGNALLPAKVGVGETQRHR